MRYSFGEHGFKHRAQWVFVALTEFRERGQWVPQPISCTPKRTHRVVLQNSPSLALKNDWFRCGIGPVRNSLRFSKNSKYSKNYKITKLTKTSIRLQKSTVGGSPGTKIAHFCKNWQFLLFIGSDFLLEIQFLAIFGQYSFQQYFFGSIFKIITRMKLLFSNYLGGYRYSFQGSSELISITVTASLLFSENTLQEIIAPRNSREFSTNTVAWRNGFRIKNVMVSKRMVICRFCSSRRANYWNESGSFVSKRNLWNYWTRPSRTNSIIVLARTVMEWSDFLFLCGRRTIRANRLKVMTIVSFRCFFLVSICSNVPD